MSEQRRESPQTDRTEAPPWVNEANWDRLVAIADAAKELDAAMVDCWGPTGTEERVTWDAPNKQVEALRKALASESSRGAQPTESTGKK